MLRFVVRNRITSRVEPHYTGAFLGKHRHPQKWEHRRTAGLRGLKHRHDRSHSIYIITLLVAISIKVRMNSVVSSYAVVAALSRKQRVLENNHLYLVFLLTINLSDSPLLDEAFKVVMCSTRLVIFSRA